MNKQTQNKKSIPVKKIAFYAIFIIPFFLGTYGMMAAGQDGDILNCSYKSIQLYVMEYGVAADPINGWIQIARWMAPVMTAAAIVSFIFSIFESLRIRWKIYTTDAIAIHGDSTNIDIVMENLGSTAIRSENPAAFKAKRQLLMFNQDLDMYRYIDEYGVQLLHDQEKQLFLCSETVLRGSYDNQQLVVCNIAENCARMYWNAHPVTNPKEKILIIGFGNYGQRILTQGILTNVLSDDSAIEYHIAGSYHDFLTKHYHMDKAVHLRRGDQEGEDAILLPDQAICENQDTVYFYEGNYSDILKNHRDFDRVIICRDLDAENISILNELKTYYVNREYHIKFSDETILESLWDIHKEGIIPFGVNSDLYNPETILKEKLLSHAKMINARYFAGYTCDHQGCSNYRDNKILSLEACANCPKHLKDWNRLNAFVRYSNVAQADHMDVKLRILLGPEADPKEAGIGEKAVAAYLAKSEEEKIALHKIEHIRWDRYHFMNNWDYAPKRDNANRLHHLLVPFDQLSDKDKQKDSDTYLSLKELYS